MFITATGAKLQDGRQAGRLRVRVRVRVRSGRVVRWAGTGSGQAMVKNQEDEIRDWGKARADTNTDWVDKQDKLATDKQRTQV
jgi:hypothetical protein